MEVLIEYFNTINNGEKVKAELVKRLKEIQYVKPKTNEEKFFYLKLEECFHNVQDVLIKNRKRLKLKPKIALECECFDFRDSFKEWILDPKVKKFDQDFVNFLFDNYLTYIEKKNEPKKLCH